ncbi:MAG: hypothetical protein MZW92_44330 [Comamonadaceae bacterium]|nr:hypothetical protein [Comamonadaceae bacterium]
MLERDDGDAVEGAARHACPHASTACPRRSPAARRAAQPVASPGHAPPGSGGSKAKQGRLSGGTDDLDASSAKPSGEIGDSWTSLAPPRPDHAKSLRFAEQPPRDRNVEHDAGTGAGYAPRRPGRLRPLRRTPPRQSPPSNRSLMTVCLIAAAVGCKKRPAFSVCPLTRVLGDQPAKPEEDAGLRSRWRPSPPPAPSAGRPCAAAKEQ